MAIKHTGNTEFHSKSNKIGSMRWSLEVPPLVPKAYAVRCAHMPHLGVLWWLVGVVHIGNKFWLRCYPAGNEADFSLDESDIATLVAGTPTINEEITVTDPQEAVDRMERGVAHMMHGLLDPLPGVAHVWRRIATEAEPVNL